MDSLSFEWAFDADDVNFYDDAEHDESDWTDLLNTDESTTILD